MYKMSLERQNEKQKYYFKILLEKLPISQNHKMKRERERETERQTKIIILDNFIKNSIVIFINKKRERERERRTERQKEKERKKDFLYADIVES